MSLRDGTKKMSKSDPSDQSRINLNDDADTIALKIRRAKTDPEPLPGDTDGLANRPEARNLVGIYAALDDKTHGGCAAGARRQGLWRVQGGADRSAGREADANRAETQRLLADPATIDATLRDGARRAAAIADPIVAKTEDLVGFLRA
jgi:tryptophanyl-tRNA synthetase